MKNSRFIKLPLLIILILMIFSGCGYSGNEYQAYMYERPAVGPTVEKEIKNYVEVLQNQTLLGIETFDGTINIKGWDKDYLQIIEKRKVKGPASKEALQALLDEMKGKPVTSSFDIKLKLEPVKTKALYRMTEDIEIMVPDTIKTINIKANNGVISISDLEAFKVASIELKKGNLDINKSTINKIYTKVEEGDLEFTGINGSGEYETDRGNIKFLDVAGDIKLKLTAGDVYIENSEGKVDSNISVGNSYIRSSRLKTDSTLYTSYGNTEVSLKNIETLGKYTIKSAKGDVRLKIPENTGWSLLAESTKGRIINNTGTGTEELKTSPSGELYGDVKGGGPMIDVYVDRGDIYLNK